MMTLDNLSLSGSEKVVVLKNSKALVASGRGAVPTIPARLRTICSTCCCFRLASRATPASSSKVFDASSMKAE